MAFRIRYNVLNNTRAFNSLLTLVNRTINQSSAVLNNLCNNAYKFADFQFNQIKSQIEHDIGLNYSIPIIDTTTGFPEQPVFLYIDSSTNKLEFRINRDHLNNLFQLRRYENPNLSINFFTNRLLLHELWHVLDLTTTIRLQLYNALTRPNNLNRFQEEEEHKAEIFCMKIILGDIQNINRFLQNSRRCLYNIQVNYYYDLMYILRNNVFGRTIGYKSLMQCIFICYPQIFHYLELNCSLSRNNNNNDIHIFYSPIYTPFFPTTYSTSMMNTLRRVENLSQSNTAFHYALVTNNFYNIRSYLNGINYICSAMANIKIKPRNYNKINIPVPTRVFCIGHKK